MRSENSRTCPNNRQSHNSDSSVERMKVLPNYCKSSPSYNMNQNSLRLCQISRDPYQPNQRNLSHSNLRQYREIPDPIWKLFLKNSITRLESRPCRNLASSLFASVRTWLKIWEDLSHSEIKASIVKSRTQFENCLLNFYHKASLEPCLCRKPVPFPLL